MSTFLEVLLILLTSMVKFVASPVVSFALGYSFMQTMIMIGIGGCTGVLIFFFAGGWIMGRIEGRRKNRRNFTRTNKAIVRLRRGQGLNGLAVMTPVIISIPIGTLIAAKYYRHEKRTLPVLLSAVLLWDVVLCTLMEWLG
jgi:hypothetical protein